VWHSTKSSIATIEAEWLRLRGYLAVPIARPTKWKQRKKGEQRWKEEKKCGIASE
jgi:hypothetical protein